MKNRSAIVRQTLSTFCIVLLFSFSAGIPLAAQQSAPSPLQPLSPDQLDNLVAPVALYPDALLSQVLVASTYPLELVEAGQWLQQNQNLQGPQLVDAARQQNWDPSIQALVVFPDVIERLNSDIRWTTDLGNAFLAQQADVMNAVQRLRAEARAAGKLNSNPQETIATDTQGGQTAIEIQPTNPEVVYVPAYNPVDVWGPPDYGYYPPLDYPDFGFGFDFGPGIYLGGFFGGLGWGGWGWGPNWFNCSIFENGSFFNHYGFRGYDGGGFGGRGVWEHNGEHRLGVAYPNQGLANRFEGNFAGRGGNAGRGFDGGRFGGAASAPATGRMNAGGNNGVANRGNFGPGQRGGQLGAGRFGSAGAQSNYRTSPGSPGSTANRSTPSYAGDYGSARTAPAYRSAPSFGGSSYRAAPSFGGGGSYGGARTAPAYRSTPAFGGGGSYGGARTAPAYRSTPAFGGGGSYGGARTAPAYRSAPSFGGSSDRAAPSFGRGGSYGGARTAPAYRSAPSFGGSSNHAAPSFARGGSGFHGGGGGGGGFHGGGSHGGGHR